MGEGFGGYWKGDWIAFHEDFRQIGSAEMPENVGVDESNPAKINREIFQATSAAIADTKRFRRQLRHFAALNPNIA